MNNKISILIIFYINFFLCHLQGNDSWFLAEANQLIDNKTEVEDIKSLFEQIVSTECYTPKVNRKTHDADYQYKNDDYGVSFESGAKFTEGDAKQNNRAIYGGLSWDILGDGYAENKIDADILELNHKLSEFTYGNFTEAKFESIQAFIISSFNNKKLEYYRRKTYFNTLYKDLIRKKYFFNMASKMDIEASSLTIERDLYLQEEYLDFDKRTGCQGLNSYHTWPYFKIDIAALKKNLYTQILGAESTKLVNRIVDEKYDWKKDARLKLYSRGEKNDGGSGVSVGLNFKLPLTNDSTEVLRYEKLHINSDRLEVVNALSILLDRQYYEFKQKVAQAIKLNYTYKKIIRKLELHRSRFLNNDKSRKLEFLKDIEEAYDVKLEILENKQQIYQKGFKVLFLSRQEAVDKFSKLQFQEEKLINSNIRTAPRSVYLWASTFNKIDNDNIVNLMKVKEIEEAVVSISKNVDVKKLVDFIPLATLKGIRTTLVYGNNAVIYEKNYDDLSRVIDKAKSLGLNLQLDVEPHAVESLKSDRDRYYEMYIKMLKFANKTADGKVKLDIAIPLHYSQKLVKDCSEYVDRIYLMAYKHSDPNYVVRKIKKFESLKDKLVIAVSPTDFKNEWEMENFIESIQEKSNINNFSIHDLRRYKELLK